MNKRCTWLVITATAVALCGSACSSSGSGSETTSAKTPAADSASLPSLIPTPANSGPPKGPDPLSNNGIHMHYQVNGSPSDVMNAYKAAFTNKGWSLETIVTSDGGGGGGATYTGTHGDAYSVIDGGGYANTTYIDVCAWPTKPADPNCTRSQR